MEALKRLEESHLKVIMVPAHSCHSCKHARGKCSHSPRLLAAARFQLTDSCYNFALQAVEAKDAHLEELRRQLDSAHRSNEGAALEHDAQLSKLIGSLQQMKDACTAQAQDIAVLTAEQKSMHAERTASRDAVKFLEAKLIKLEV